MIWLGLGVAGVALTIIGLMPGSIYDDRQGLVALVVAGFGVMVGVDFLKSRAEHVGRAQLAEGRYAGWQTSRDRRLDLRQRGRNRARRIGSRRVSRTARVSAASLRRQADLRVAQGRRKAGRKRSNVNRHPERIDWWTDELAPISRKHLKGASRSRAGRSSRTRVSSTAIERQRELRIQQGQQYAAEDDADVRLGSETLGERRKRERLRRRQEKYWKETSWGCGG
ncbi:MAG: hypothetical protein OXQ29_26545 [Rhodospirillaceae bacterium]|nr:hypothetical protein [Rhodospirillaceae bacterium]